MIVLHKDRDITDYVSSISWGGSKSEVSRKLELSVINAPLDKNITPLVMDLAEPVYLFEDDGVTELFRGFITDREAVSATGTIKYTAYDILFYTTKSTATYNFSSKTAETITQMVCDDMQIPKGEIATTGLSQKLIVDGKSIYDIIMQAYTQAHEKNGKQYYVVARKGKLCVEEMGNKMCKVELTDESNITSSKYTETITNMVNKVRIYTDKGVASGMVQNDEDIAKYGIFQQVYKTEKGKDPKATAKSMFKGVEKTFSLDCTNYNDAVTGAGVIVTDSATGLSGLAWIEADTHTWSDGVATMSLTLALKQIMDKKT